MEQSQDLRLPGVPDPTERDEKTGEADADVFAVRGRDVLLRRARRSALADAREPLPRSSLGIRTTMMAMKKKMKMMKKTKKKIGWK